MIMLPYKGLIQKLCQWNAGCVPVSVADKSSNPCCSLQVVDTSKTISEIPEWFQGCQLNYAENLLKHPDGDKVAFITCGKVLSECKSSA